MAAAKKRVDLSKAIQKAARALPDVDEGVACEGTALESRTWKTNKKAFVFLGKRVLRLKLDASLKEATKLAAKEPDHYDAGAGGWVKVVLAAQPSVALLTRWIAESHALVTPAKRRKG